MGQGTNIQIIRYTVYKSSYMSDILSSDRCMYQGKEYKQGGGVAGKLWYVLRVWRRSVRVLQVY